MGLKHKLKIVIAGGSGFIGSAVQDFFKEEEVWVLTRSPSAKNHLAWDGRTVDQWAGILEEVDLLINLTGLSIQSRLSKYNRNEILRSRVDSTLVLGKAIQTLSVQPKLWINASGVGIFSDSPEIRVESNTQTDQGFLSRVCQEWESAFWKSEVKSRKIILRMGVVMDRHHGLLPLLMRLAKLGFGAPLGHQWVSWIAIQDLLQLIKFLLEKLDIKGVVHASSPCPVTHHDMMNLIRKKAGMPFYFPAPIWAVKLLLKVAQRSEELIFKSNRVISEKIKGFHFIYPSFDRLP